MNGELDSFSIFYQIEGSIEQHIKFDPMQDIGPYQETISDLLPNSEYTISIIIETAQGNSDRSTPVTSITHPLSM